jgi:molybdate transport system substrate-binding protein
VIRAALIAAVLLATAARAEDVLVFAAASSAEALTDVAHAFEVKTHVHVIASFAGSSTLARQIEQGAPADLFLSADLAQLQKVAAFARSQKPLLGNRLVTIVPAGAAPLQPEQLATLKRIAIADPTSVPAGVYAKQWLGKLGLWDRLAPRVVPSLDVRAALAQVEGAAVQAGVVYATDAASSKAVRVVFTADAKDSPEIVYPVALLKHGGPAAAKFYEFLSSPEAKVAFARRGFLVR